ncbi:MAG: beta-galactosidase, partial [Promethearchaeota archaeon]
MSEKILITPRQIFIRDRPVLMMAEQFPYYEVDPKQWEQYLKELKIRGINTAIIPILWDFHQASEEKIDLQSPTRNIEKICTICKELGLFIIVEFNPVIVPNWLLTLHPEIVDYKVDSKSSERIFLHHLNYQKYLRSWLEKLIIHLRNYQFPASPIIFLQININFNIENTSPLLKNSNMDSITKLKNVYFNDGFHPENLVSYHDWLEKKYLIIEALNECYLAEYDNFKEVNFPSTKDFRLSEEFNTISRKNLLLRFLDWMEFKEERYHQFLAKIYSIFVENGLLIPVSVIFSSYKSPFDLRNLLKLPCFQRKDPNLLSGLIISNDIVNSEVNFNCFLSWHTEWMKNELKTPPYFDFEFPEMNNVLKPYDLHNLFRLAMIHGGKVFSISSILHLNPISIHQLNNFAEWVKLNFQVIQKARKAYDYLTLAYYHPVTRLKSLKANINSINFDFPLNYVKMKKNYKSILQLLVKYSIHYDVVDLEEISQQNLQKKPFLMLYFIGWMDHGIMEKIVIYVKNGGTLISFGDIPILNEAFEKDYTLFEIYNAQVMDVEMQSMEKIPDCEWTGIGHTEKLNHISLIYEYNILNSDNLRILAHEGDFTRVFAFTREIELGKIVHSGIFPDKDVHALPYLMRLLEAITFPTKNVNTSQECVAIQTITSAEERFICVGNLNNESIADLSLSFFNPNAKKFNALLNIDNIKLPSHLCHLWHAFLYIDPMCLIRLSTCEIYSMKNGHVKARFYSTTVDPDGYQGILILQFQSQYYSLDIIKGEGKVKEIFRFEDQNKRTNEKIIQVNFTNT